MSSGATDFPLITNGAQTAADAERKMTIRDALKKCNKGIYWSLVFTSAIVMEGFDLALLSGFYAFPAFQREYGVYDPIGKDYEIPPGWQTALSAGAMIGQIIGLSVAGLVTQRIGYKRTMVGALSLMIAFIFIPFFAPSLGVLLFGEIMQGIPWGVFETMPAAYASEVSPMVLRPYITTYANLCWVFGQLIAAGILRGCLSMGNTEWAFRIPFSLQWIWPLPILVFVLYAPESPWWLERRGESEKAVISLQRVTNYGNEEINNIHELIKHTVLMEKQRYEEEVCFKGVDRRRSEITCGAWISQSLCGSNLMAFAPYFFNKAGLDIGIAYTLQVVGLALGAAGTGFAWILMKNLGRRTIYVWGLGSLFSVLLVTGLLAVIAPKTPWIAWAEAILLVIYIVVYDSTLGPCCYSIVTEIPSTRLKPATVAIARICYNLCGIFSVVMNPLMLNSQGWNWGPRAALFWAGLCFCCWIWAFYRLPEPKGRNYGELDVLFHRRVKARDFKKTSVDQFSSDALIIKRTSTTPSAQAASTSRSSQGHEPPASNRPREGPG
ncbi:putative general alpha-glucoside permease [Xylariales sp. AK1849]|nr:putative general alpha-glucoside permease [Xylariales sp. AK1849]